MKNLRTCFSNGIAGLLALVSFTMAPVAGAAEEGEGRVVADWSAQTVGSPAQSPGREVVLRMRSGAKPLIVGGEGGPVSPFAGRHAALGLPSRGDEVEGESVTLRLNLFQGKTPPPKGWVEAEVALENRHITFGPVLGASPSFAIYFLSDSRILLVYGSKADDTRKRIPLSAKVTLGAVHTFRMAWELDGGQPGFRFFLDGKALTLADGSEVYPVDLSGVTVTGARITLNGGGTYVGTVRASE